MDKRLTDRELAATLRRVVGDPPYNIVDWNALAQRIHAAARSRVRTPRAPRWWEFAAGWTRVAVSLAVAASIAAFALAVTARPATEAITTEPATLMGTVTGSVPDQALLLSAGGSTSESFAAEVLAQ